jgi:hypothetical protein
MASARGDRKPCSHAACPGTMQFAREQLPQTSSAPAAEGGRGWVCSESSAHFQSETESARLEKTTGNGTGSR